MGFCLNLTEVDTLEDKCPTAAPKWALAFCHEQMEDFLLLGFSPEYTVQFTTTAIAPKLKEIK